MASEEVRRDAEAALAARQELGPSYDEYVAQNLADRVEELVVQRRTELARSEKSEDAVWKAEKESMSHRLALGIVSLGVGIPITAISATNVEPGLLGVIVSWAGIVGVNVAVALGHRRSVDRATRR